MFENHVCRDEVERTIGKWQRLNVSGDPKRHAVIAAQGGAIAINSHAQRGCVREGEFIFAWKKRPWPDYLMSTAQIQPANSRLQ
jgi:hypothetical protein